MSPDDPPALVFWPFGTVGVCQLLAAAYSGQRIVLLEKFTVEAWVDAVKRHRVKWSGVQPTVIRMLLEADVPPSDLASLDYLPGGSGPLEPELQREFETRYGIPLLWGYGATEFAGTVCTWTPQLRAEYGDIEAGHRRAAAARGGGTHRRSRTAASPYPAEVGVCCRRGWTCSARTGSPPPTSRRSTTTGS